MFKTIIPALALSAMVAPAFAANNWTTDFPAALEQAAKEQKLVLVNFNGSDWCAPCITLKTKVFDTSDFLTFAKDKFVLVDIDFPRKKVTSPELYKANKAMVERYAVIGFPSIFVMNTQGIVVDGFFGDNDSVSAVQAILDAAISNAAKLQIVLDKAALLEGAEKAKTLYAAYQMLACNLRDSNVRLMDEIKALDTEDSLGLKKAAAKAVAEAEYSRINSQIIKMGKDSPELIEFMDSSLENDKLDVESRMELSAIKADIMLYQAESLADVAAAKAWLLGFPKSKPCPEIVSSMMEKMLGEPEKLLKDAKLARSILRASQIAEADYSRITSNMELLEDNSDLLNFLEKELANDKITASVRLELSAAKADLMVFMAVSLEDIAAAKAWSLSLVDSHSDSKKMRAGIEQMYANPAKMLEKSKESRALREQALARNAESARIISSFQALMKEPYALIKFIDKELENDELDEELRESLGLSKRDAMLFISLSFEDIAAAKLWGLSFAKTLPNPEDACLELEEMFADPAKLLEEAKENRAYAAEYYRIDKSLKELDKDPQALIKFIDKELANDKLSTDFRRNLGMHKVNTMIAVSESLDDLAAAKAWGLSFAETFANPVSACDRLEEIFANPVQVLKKAKENRAKNKGVK